MAKNDVILLDGILDERSNSNLPSDRRDEVFEYLATEQILKDFDLTSEDLLQGSVDGQNDGGIDGFYIFINGHPLIDRSTFFWPRTNGELEVHIITCKHHDTFKMQTIDSIIASLTELFDFSLAEKDLKGEYNSDLLEKRKDFIFSYRKLSSLLTKFNIKISYASRGDSTSIGENIIARAEQIITITKSCFGACNAYFDFWGSSEILNSYRKLPKYSLDLIFQEVLSQGEQVKGSQYILLAKLKSYFNFIVNEEGKLRKYLFDSNVRDYMGLNPVNEDIMKTLESNTTSDFWWLNNGITILATSASVVGKSINIDNVQIVNGLQTSETIFKFFINGNKDPQGRSILIKVIVSNDVEVRDSIIRATNNQTNVELASLHATDKIQRDIEDMLFKYGLHYERRINYYSNQGISKALIFTPLYLASGYTSLILKLPHNAVSLKSKFMRNQEKYNNIFSTKIDLHIWPVIAKIMRETDLLLEKVRPLNKMNTDKFLKNTRQITAFITVSRLLGTFNFSCQDLIKFDIIQYSQDEIRKTWTLINGLIDKEKNRHCWKSKEFSLNICEKASVLYSIKGYESICYRKEGILTKKYKSKEDAQTKQYKQYEIDDAFIDEVDKLLPEQPWKPGVHVFISSQMGCPAGKVSQAIKILVDRGLRNKQINGIVYSNDGSVLCCDGDRINPKTI